MVLFDLLCSLPANTDLLLWKDIPENVLYSGKVGSLTCDGSFMLFAVDRICEVGFSRLNIKLGRRVYDV